MLSLELLVHRRLVDHADIALRRLGQLDEVLRMAAPQLVGLPAPFELLERVLTDRLEHREPAVCDAAEQAAVHEGGEDRKQIRAVVGTNRLDGVDRAAAREHREPREQDALGLGEERVAPVERRAKRLLPARKIARAACEHVERLFEPLHHPRRRQQLAARGGELDRERQPVEPPADLRDVPRTLLCRARRRDRRHAHARRRGERRRWRRAPRTSASRRGSAARSGGTGYSCSPRRRSGARLVASTASRGAAASSSATSGAAWSSCSKLSSSEQDAPVAQVLRERIGGGRSPSSTSSASRSSSASSAGSATGARSTKTAPSRSSAASSSATASASRVLPVPPGPVSVTRRTSSRRSSAVTAAISSRRPTSGVGGVGRRRAPARACSGAAERRIVAEDAALELLQRRAGLDAELVDEHSPGRAVRVERVLLPSRAVEREDVLLAQALAERLLGEQLLELGEQRVVPPERELGVVPQLDRRQAQRRSSRPASVSEIGSPARSASGGPRQSASARRRSSAASAAFSAASDIAEPGRPDAGSARGRARRARAASR